MGTDNGLPSYRDSGSSSGFTDVENGGGIRHRMKAQVTPSGGEHARRVTFVLVCVVVLALVGNLWILLAVKQATSECLPCPETPASTVRLAEKVLKKKFFLVFFLFFLFLPKKV